MYLAIDIETTGLDTDKHQILQIGAVIDEQNKAVMECPYFECVVKHDEIVGAPYALVMNQWLLKAIATGEGRRLEHIMDSFRNWLARYLGFCPYQGGQYANTAYKAWQVVTRKVPGYDPPFTLLGKNLGQFDVQMLKRAPNWPKDMFGYRCMDVGSLYATPAGMQSQGELEDKISRDLGINGKKHAALHDARVSLALARLRWGLDI
jgi:oligoribonuclease (3'-5' exoribonuclease)